MGFVMTKYYLIHMIFHYMLYSHQKQLTLLGRHFLGKVTVLSFVPVVVFPTLSDLPRDPAGPVVLLLVAAPVLANAMSNLLTPNHILLPIIIQKGPEPLGKIIPLLLLLLEEEGVVRTVVPELPLPLEEGRDGRLGVPGGRSEVVAPQEGERGAAAVARQSEDGDGAARVDVVVEVVAKVGRAHAHL